MDPSDKERAEIFTTRSAQRPLADNVTVDEDAVELPDRTFPAASSPTEYRNRLRGAHRAMTDPDEWLFSWGYHELWHTATLAGAGLLAVAVVGALDAIRRVAGA